MAILKRPETLLATGDYAGPLDIPGQEGKGSRLVSWLKDGEVREAKAAIKASDWKALAELAKIGRSDARDMAVEALFSRKRWVELGDAAKFHALVRDPYSGMISGKFALVTKEDVGEASNAGLEAIGVWGPAGIAIVAMDAAVSRGAPESALAIARGNRDDGVARHFIARLAGDREFGEYAMRAALARSGKLMEFAADEALKAGNFEAYAFLARKCPDECFEGVRRAFTSRYEVARKMETLDFGPATGRKI